MTFLAGLGNRELVRTLVGVFQCEGRPVPR